MTCSQVDTRKYLKDQASVSEIMAMVDCFQEDTPFRTRSSQDGSLKPRRKLFFDETVRSRNWS